MDCSGLTSIDIPNSVTTIGKYVFNRCSGLTNIEIPSSVTEIGDGTFLGCSSLTSIEIPNSVTSIGDSAFSSCSGLTSIDIPNSVTTIGERAFYSCSGLTSIDIPNSVTSIGDYAFKGCSGLTSLTIHGDVPSIGRDVFTDSPLKTVVYGDGVTKITTGMYDTQFINEVIIGQSVTSIERYAFESSDLKKVIWLPNTPPSGYRDVYSAQHYVANEQYGFGIVYQFLSSIFEVDGIRYVPVSPSERTCDAIGCTYDGTSIVKIDKTVAYRGIDMKVNNLMPYLCFDNDSIETIEINIERDIAECAFYGCDSIKSISIDANTIGDKALYSCKNLVNVILGERIKTIGKEGFYGCVKLQSIILSNSLASLGASAFSDCSLLSSIHIGSGLEKIEKSAFYGCSALSTITIPANVTSIANNVFEKCTSLAEVNISDRNTELSLGYNNTVYYNDNPLFSDCPLKKVYIGGNITYNTSKYCGYSPFYRNTTLESVTITDKETEISENMFYGCTGLKSITMGDGVETIGNWAFSGCASLESFSYGSSMKTIGQEAFSDCTALTSLTSKATTPPTCGTNALDDINKWNCTLYVPKGTQSQYAAADQWKEFFFISDDVENKVIMVQSLTLDKTAWEGEIGESVQLVATVSPDNATNKMLEWSSSDATVASVDNTGKVTALKEGKATITAKTTDGSNLSATCEVTVKAKVVLAESISFDKTSWSGTEGESFQIAATVVPNNATSKALTWSSSNKAVASVDNTGKVTTLKEGKATITAKTTDGSNLSATCEVTVKAKVVLVESISFDQTSWSVTEGESFLITATVTPNNATSKALTWSSSNKAVATVDNTGKVTALKEGKATITAKTTDGSNLSAACEVTVKAKVVLVESISLSPSSWSGEEGETFVIIATVLPSDATNDNVYWSSSDVKVATVRQNGKVSVLKEGTCKIIVEATDGSGVSAECIITSTTGILGVLGDAQGEWDVYDMNGKILKADAGKEYIANLTPGAYILRQGSTVKKLIVR